MPKHEEKEKRSIIIKVGKYDHCTLREEEGIVFPIFLSILF